MIPIDSSANLINSSSFEDSSMYLDVSNRKFSRSMSIRSDTSSSSIKPTLHEVILAEKMDFEAKLERMSKRKQWLRIHQQLLRTLASYCMLQGSGGGGLASVQMELLLLLQASFHWYDSLMLKFRSTVSKLVYFIVHIIHANLYVL